MFKIAICDDEGYFRERIKNIVEAYMKNADYICEIDCYETGEKFIQLQQEKTDYDIVFLDINMKEMDGIEAAELLRMRSPETYIVFITAFINYALDGYKVNAIRFIIKEDSKLKGEIKECLDAIISKMNYKETKCTFKFQSGTKEVAVEKIVYVESVLHKVVFHLVGENNSENYMYTTLNSVEENLVKYDFYRVHQSFLVNVQHIDKLMRYKIVLNDGREIGVSKKYFKKIEYAIIKYKGEI